MSGFDQLTRGISARTNMADAAANYARDTVSYIFEAIAALFTLGVGAAGIEAWHHENRELHRLDFAKAAPRMLIGMHKQLMEANGSKLSTSVRYGDDVISITQHHGGVEFVDVGSRRSRVFNGESFQSIMSWLAQEIEAKPERYGEQATCIASIVSADPEVMAGQKPRDRNIGYQEAFDSLTAQLEVVQRLPVDERVGLLQALARTMPQVLVDDCDAYKPIYDAGANLSSRDRRTLSATLARLAPSLHENHRCDAWMKCFVDINDVNNATPEDQGAALAALAGTLSACIKPMMGLSLRFADIRDAVFSLEHTDPHKGKALAELALVIPRLAGNCETNFTRILSSVIDLDRKNPKKGEALWALACGIQLLPETVQQTIFERILSAVLSLSDPDLRKGAALGALVHSIAETSLVLKPATFKAILKSADRLETGPNGWRGQVLAGLAGRVPDLPVADRPEAFEAVLAAVVGLKKNDAFKGQAVNALLRLFKDLPDNVLPDAFRDILPAFFDLRSEDSLRAALKLDDVIRRLPDADQPAASDMLKG